MIRRSIGAVWRLCLCAALLAATGEAAGATPSRKPAVSAPLEAAMAEARQKRARGERVWCVPFARTASGVEIKGNAKTWWAQAAGRYARGHEPQVGAVMVFAGSRAMPMGHVAVVSGLVDDRTILIDHANWKRNQVSLGMVVHDVSKKGDWTAVRVEGDPGVMGRVNPVSGFIYPGAVERVAAAE